MEKMRQFGFLVESSREPFEDMPPNTGTVPGKLKHLVPLTGFYISHLSLEALVIKHTQQ